MKKTILSFLFISAAFCLQSQIVINEFSAANIDQFFNEFGEDEDWVELYNTSNDFVDLTGYHLSDREDNTDKWTFPAGSGIPANGFLLVWCDGRDEFVTNHHTNFKLTQTRTDEVILVSDPSGNILDINQISVPNQLGDSWGRIPNGTGDFMVNKAPTPGDSNSGNAHPRYASYVNIKPASGAKTGPIEVTIEPDDLQGGTIYYTLDGSIPSPSNGFEYTGPIPINSTTVVRSRVLENNVSPGYIETNSYFINENHEVKIISIAGGNELSDLMAGSFNEPIASFEYFDVDGTKKDEAVGEFNKHGNDSWAYDQRGVDYITRDQFGYDSDIDDKIFNLSDRESFQRLILKAAANDNATFENGGAHIRDAYVHTLSQIANLEMDERTYEPCVLYVNGEYWGVYEIREKVDDHDYTKFNYDQGKMWIDFIKTWGVTWEEYGSWDDWYDLTDYIENNDLTIDANYEYVQERLNLLSLADYLILHSFNLSSDWLNWNTGWWRGRKETGGAKKWRYILWDEDATFDHYINYSNVPSTDPNADPCDFEFIPDFTDFEGHIGIYNKLFDNEDFVQLYINRYADLNNSYLSCDFAIPLLDSLIDNIRPEMPRQFDRWGGSMAEWETNVNDLRDFILTRCTVLDEGIVDCYEDEGISGPYDVFIDVQPPGSGRVRANTVTGLSYPWQSTYFDGIDIELEALPNGMNSFLYWEVKNNAFGPSDLDKIIDMNLTSADTIVAYFSDVPCVEPANLIVNTAPGEAFLEWSGGGNVTFEVNYKLNTESDWSIFSTLDPETTLTDLMMCAEYDLRIRTICANSVSDYVDFSVQTWCTTSTEDLAGVGISKLNLFPNPFNESVHLDIELNDASLQQIRIYDSKGSLVKSYNEVQGQRILLDQWNNMDAGIYQVQLLTTKGGVLRKLVKM